jgi:hypothetical protein
VADRVCQEKEGAKAFCSHVFDEKKFEFFEWGVGKLERYCVARRIYACELPRPPTTHLFVQHVHDAHFRLISLQHRSHPHCHHHVRGPTQIGVEPVVGLPVGSARPTGTGIIVAVGECLWGISSAASISATAIRTSPVAARRANQGRGRK